MGQIRDMLEIRQLLSGEQDECVVDVEELRDAYGKKKLGKNVQKDISRQLKALGLGHDPLPPHSKGATVRIYKLGLPGERHQAVTSGTLAGRAKNMQDFKHLVEINEDVCTIDMIDLRDAYGADTVNARVNVNISNSLKGLGLAHYPVLLPERLDKPVRIYKQGTPVAALIDAALEADTSRDEVLRRAAGGKATIILEKIRELVS